MNPRIPLLTALLLSIVPASAADSPGALVVEEPGGTRVEMPLEHTNVSIEVSAFVARATVGLPLVFTFTNYLFSIDTTSLMTSFCDSWFKPLGFEFYIRSGHENAR